MRGQKASSPFGVAFRSAVSAAVAIPLCLGPASGQESLAGDPDIAILQALEQRISRNGFDVLAALRALPSVSPETIFLFVRNETRLVPYRGMLRGARGVLMDRLGNSLDRALLLAEMLREAGSEVRLARATLGADEAQRLLDLWQGASAPPLPAFAEHAARLAAWGREIDPTDAGPVSPVPFLENWPADGVTAQVAALDRLLDGHWRAGEPGYAADVSDHWWVQFRDGEKWVDLDPSLPNGRRGERLTDADEFFAVTIAGAELAVPEVDRHTLEIAVVIEQLTGGALTEHRPLTAPVVPAYTIGLPISLQIVPAELPDPQTILGAENPALFFRDYAAAQPRWIPEISVGAQTSFGEAFDAEGYLGEAPAEVPLLGGPFGGPFAAATNALREPGVLTAVWVEYTIRAPGVAEQRVERSIADVLGPAARATYLTGTPIDAGWEPTDRQERERALALSERIEIVPQVSAHTPDYASARLLGSFIPNLLALDNLGEAEVPPLSGPAELLAVLRREWNPGGDGAYVAGINVLSTHFRLAEDANGEPAVVTALDIVATEIVPMPSSSRPQLQRLRQGVIDTNAEWALLPDRNEGNAGRLLADDLARGIAWHVVDSIAALDAAALPPNDAARIAAALAEGDLAIVPTGAPDGAFAWWRVDPVTGATIGVGSQGWGQQKAEYPILVGRRQRGEGNTEYIVLLAFVMACVVVELAKYIHPRVGQATSRNGLCLPARSEEPQPEPPPKNPAGD